MSTAIKRKGFSGSKQLLLTKQQIRSKMLLKLKLQKEEERERKSNFIKEKLFRSLLFKKAKIIMFYVSFAGEVETQEMIRQALNLRKIIAVPICTKDRTIRPCLFNAQARLRRGPYGIYEPAAKRCLSPKSLDLVIAPGLAFDRKGNRLGRGKGYYDRFLEKLLPKIASVGLAFDFQILPVVPTTANDQRVNQVIFA